MCSCEGEAVSIDTPVDEGFSAAELVAYAQGGAPLATWFGLPGTPTTSFAYASSYEGGLVFDEVGGCCGLFLCGPCPKGATVEVRMNISSSDGTLDESVVGTLTGDLSEGEQQASFRTVLQIGDVVGTANTQPFVIEGEPFVVDSLIIEVSWPGFGGDGSEPYVRIVGIGAEDVLTLAESTFR